MKIQSLILAGCMVAAAAWSAPVLAEEQEAPTFHLGGAVRFNDGWLDYGPTSRLQLELLRVDMKGSSGPAFFSLQYRWYDGFSAVHHAWAGWKLNEDSDVRVGVQQVPFGLLPTASQSFWFGSGYYLGLEDDYDLGVAWQHTSGADQWHVAYFAGDEYGSGGRYDRYSFDVARTGALPYRERGRLHVRYEHSSDWQGGALKLGASAFSGQVQDVDTHRHYEQDGGALHAQWQRQAVTWQLQWARYRYRVPGDRIALSAFMAPLEIAAQADVPSFNVAYALPHTGPLDSVTCYNNFSATLPVGKADGLRDSMQNVTGCSLGKGPMLVYLDWIAGRNMWFAGGNGIGIDDGQGGWHSRLNLNIGFYF